MAKRSSPNKLPAIGRYHLLRVVGYGGFATVYEAEDTEDGSPVAVKILKQNPSATEADEVAEQFYREVCSAARLAHPNIVRVLDAGFDRRCYLVMELLEGRSLRDRFADGPFEFDSFSRLARDLCEALQYAHGCRIVHCDLKPENIMDCGTTFKVMDFGIARAISTTVVMSAGTVCGTPAYMSPEQIRSEPVDWRTDIYSAGLILAEALTGERVFPASDLPDLLGRILHQGARISTLPPGLEGIAAVLARSTSRHAEERPPNALQFFDELRPFLKDPNSGTKISLDSPAVAPDILLPHGTTGVVPPSGRRGAKALRVDRFPVFEQLVRLACQKASGRLVVEGGKAPLAIDVQEGRLTRALGGPPQLALGAQLLASGFLSARQLNEIMGARVSADRLGDRVVSCGLVTAVQLSGVLRRQAEARVEAAVRQAQGRTAFFEGFVDGGSRSLELDLLPLMSTTLTTCPAVSEGLISRFLEWNQGVSFRLGRNVDDALRNFELPHGTLGLLERYRECSFRLPAATKDAARRSINVVMYLLFLCDGLVVDPATSGAEGTWNYPNRTTTRST